MSQDESAPPEFLAELCRVVRESDEAAERLYTTVYIAAWLSLREGDEPEQVWAEAIKVHLESDRQPDLFNDRELLDAEGFEDLIEDLIEGYADVDVHDSQDGAVCQALADVFCQRPPRFPRWFNPRVLETIAGKSDWLPGG
jgi:hypothetical protein